MLRINCPLPDGEKPSELMRRLLNARADDERRELAPGETRRKKSTRPLTPARIERVFAVLRVALNDAVPGKIMVNPYDGVKLPKVRTTKPLAWTPQRETAFRAGFDKRMRAASAGRDLTTVEKQRLWAAQDLRPCKVMVWLPEHTGRFLDSISGERLYALFCLTAYCGLRRDEVIGLTWAEVDLDQGIAYVRETGSGDGPKSDAGTRVVPLPVTRSPGAQSLARPAGRRQSRLGSDWTDTGLVFTREDGTGVPGQWVSVRFETLAYRAGLPPVPIPRFAPRRGQPVQGRGAGHQVHLSAAGPHPDQLHRSYLRPGLPRGREGGSRGRRGHSPPGRAGMKTMTGPARPCVAIAWPYAERVSGISGRARRNAGLSGRPGLRFVQSWS